MFPVRKELGPRRRILFLGGRSFEFEESNGPDGKCGLSIVEQGEGLRRAVVLNASEVRWLVDRMRLASQEPSNLKFWGRLSGGSRTTAVWVRGEEGGGTSLQIVTTTGQRREQVYVPASAFGDGWDAVALVVDGFGLGVTKASRSIFSLGQTVSTSAADCPPVGAVCSEVEIDWFRILDRSLVGTLGGLGGKGLSFATIFDWVSRWWKDSGKVDVRPVGDKGFLLDYARYVAEALLRRRWTVEGRELFLEWWSPLAFCTPAKTSRPEKSVWIRLSGLPIHLRGEAVYRFIGDRCGGFMEADESSVDLGSIRLRVRGSEAMPSRVSIRWGLWKFSLPVWVEVDPVVERWSAANVPMGESAPKMVGPDSAQLGQIFRPQMGVNEYLHRFRFGGRSMGSSGHFTQIRGAGSPREIWRASAETRSF
ncbi:hypothetical protein LOK49_LG13G00570 [Camellia lanceoleosa]|uniref:Uncharacterized protein n=1 Tax=Camellia lanceoleosa TaxID=1840588 RepID=A0ACC0FKS4_9ERIC|nr:hypothetical protein LOK49_LG13G00570 [Camellia lanceoleosa]